MNHTRGKAIKYGQSNFDISDEMDVTADRCAPSSARPTAPRD